MDEEVNMICVSISGYMVFGDISERDREKKDLVFSFVFFFYIVLVF